MGSIPRCSGRLSSGRRHSGRSAPNGFARIALFSGGHAASRATSAGADRKQNGLLPVERLYWTVRWIGHGRTPCAFAAGQPCFRPWTAVPAAARAASRRRSRRRFPACRTASRRESPACNCCPTIAVRSSAARSGRRCASACGRRKRCVEAPATRRWRTSRGWSGRRGRGDRHDRGREPRAATGGHS